ncbi:TonB-dependent receptor domain-containing protein [Chitinimonas sp. BJB300]|uniref:TonB-dependent receptor domain-containing protein n=1 Tax=Chitinimonas sp. BJB300 TaxID=1559339 RepID=UPI0013047564|nr:TonB-dependent receptor [Chitinimonas sp. BJB300]
MLSRTIHPFAITLLATSLHSLSAPYIERADEVIVTAARVPQTQKEAIGDLTVLNRADLDTFRGQTLAEVLPAQAGVQFTNNGGPGKASSLFLRGTNAGHTIVLIDGIRFGSPTLGSASLQHLPVDQIERVEILRGAAASLYGSDAIGGVIQIFTRTGKQAKQPAISLGGGSHGSRNLSAHVGGEVDTTRYTIGFGYSETDGISSIANPSNPNYYADKDSYRNGNLSASLSHHVNDTLELGANLFYAKVRSQYDGSVYDNAFNPTAQAFDYRDNGEQGSMNLWTRMQFNDTWQAHFRAGTSVDRGTNFTPQAYDNLTDKQRSINSQQQTFSWQNEIKVGSGTALVGLETLQQKVSGDTAYAVSQRRINSLFGGYLTSLGPLRLQSNLRYDKNSQFGDHASAQLGGSWHLNPTWQLGSNLGTGFRAPSFNDLYWPGSESPDLKPETSFNREVFTRFKADNLQGGLTLYRNTVRDLIAWAPTSPGSTNWKPANIGRAQLTGATLSLDWQSQQWMAGGHFDWLDAKDASGTSSDGKQLARRARQVGAVYTGIKFGKLDAKLEVQAQGKRFDNAANTVRLAGYSLVNLAANWQLARDWQLSARLNNVFDKDYVQVTDYGTLGRNGLISLRWQPKGV